MDATWRKCLETNYFLYFIFWDLDIVTVFGLKLLTMLIKIIWGRFHCKCLLFLLWFFLSQTMDRKVAPGKERKYFWINKYLEKFSKQKQVLLKKTGNSLQRTGPINKFMWLIQFVKLGNYESSNFDTSLIFHQVCWHSRRNF